MSLIGDCDFFDWLMPFGGNFNWRSGKGIAKRITE